MSMGRSFLCLFLLFSQGFSQPSQDQLDARVRTLLHESLSGELAKEHVIQISCYHRIQGSRGYCAAAQYVREQLRACAYSDKDAYIESYKSDGRVVYQAWQSPSGWDLSWAELRMMEPHEERLVGFPEIAMSVITYSNPGDVTAELVWAGEGTSDENYTGKDVVGKIVLATGYGGSVHRLAVLKYDAKAVVCYLDEDRAKDHPDMLQDTGTWPRTDAETEALSSLCLGPEWNGTMPYIDAHPELAGPELGGKSFANLNLHMVGENQELLHFMLIMTRTPHSIPSVLTILTTPVTILPIKKIAPVTRAAVDERVPVRLTRGPLDFGLPESKLPKGGAGTGPPRYHLNGDVRFEIPNLIDGKRSITDIERALVGEFGSAPVEGFRKLVESW